MYKKRANVSDMVGVTLISISGVKDSEIIFTAEDGREWRMWHEQDCCESVEIEDVVGDIRDLVGTPLLLAEQVSSEDGPDLPREESYTWTFYKFATVKGDVLIRWLGTSNGYYSEAVDFCRKN